MAHEHKKRLVNYLFLTFGLCFLPFTAKSSDNNNFDIVNEAVYKKQNNQQKTNKAPIKKESTKPTSSEKITLQNKIDYIKRAKLQEEKRRISKIHVSGNKVITKDSIIHRLPLKKGDIFNLNYTATMIKNLYKTGYFHQVKIYAEPIGENDIDLHIVVQEKPRLTDVNFVGNKALSDKELKEELKIKNIPTLAKEELTAIISKLRKLYQKKNYHSAEIKGQITPKDDGKISAEFNIKEGKKSYLTKISFKGNKHISSKKLKRIALSKEDWLLGMIDHSGVYNPEMIEGGDKPMLEDAYQSNGFVHAKIARVETEKNPKTGNYHITFVIHEGNRYTIKSVSAPGNDILSEEELKNVIPIFPGQFYSKEKVRNSLENLKLLWGEHGYIFADIDPTIDIDEKDKTVSITFHADLKDQVHLNRLTIKGNKKSKDSVIRRCISLNEGELITNQKMESSKSRVNLLNYFDQKNGVNWKTTKIDNTNADLELLLKEVKTGHFQFNLGYGGSPTNRVSPQSGLNLTLNAGDRNLGGSGIATSSSIEISKKYRAFNFGLVNPWLFDKPIRGSANVFIKKSEYDNVDIAENHPFERAVGGSLSVGYMSSKLNGFLIEGVLSYEKISYDEELKAAKRLGKDLTLAQIILNQNFQAGAQVSFICNITQDKRNGLVFATQGHQWSWTNQFTFPGSSSQTLPNSLQDCLKDSQFQYYRSELDVSWYTPLIGEHDLVLCVHGNAGFIHRFKDKQVPWKTLYHVGGPTTIRGYTYGQVGPTWKDTSLGSTRAFNVNVEFIAPLSSNHNTRGVIFYDGGAGWNTPYRDDINKLNPLFCKELQNNNFFYRHSVGVGIRIKSPSPLQIDFGIKLNPSKKLKKELTQLHFNVEHAF